ncbi:Sec-independent protein translocase protein TatB [Pseudooctadecabacter jejudonensis]|uniref:Sec-independent protein translocase protein TatB n=1 Tax=Pseudooctadecabacter jejudonensis TaxID=1391910 RepID=A0A1Y5T999_9RHOB|nr:Sec-independent protein translocase protein TatB [Pseudooctadecabacter jejudonensis]SLN58577.1 Sec-independent protein translocase protein TatB [Pseudooctadecabacter jejudonensis]
MFDLGFMEMLVIGVVALIVVGPKDLPGLFRSAGQFVGKAKGMAREFSSAMNAAADEAGVSEINKTIKAAANPQKFGADKIREATKMKSSDEVQAEQRARAEAKAADAKPQNETDKLRAKMTDERKATAEKISKAMAEKAEARMAAEKAAAEAAAAEAKDGS